jgi:hypothetical protein
MTQANSVHSTPPINTSKLQKPETFLNAIGRVHLSHLMQDPFVREAFDRAEHEPDDDFGELVETDHPPTLDGGAAERMTETAGHRVPAMVEA